MIAINDTTFYDLYQGAELAKANPACSEDTREMLDRAQYHAAIAFTRRYHRRRVMRRLWGDLGAMAAIAVTLYLIFAYAGSIFPF